MSLGKLNKDFDLHLMNGEQIVMDFEPIRDTFIFTDKRIIIADKQGAAEMKMRVRSINLFSIMDIRLETSGFGFDDSGISFTYVSSPELNDHHVTYENYLMINGLA